MEERNQYGNEIQRPDSGTAEPGRTPGQAEGGRGEERAADALQEPGPTASQAEGDRETVEEDLRQKGQQETAR